MSDEHGGFQHFLFSWLGWPRVDVATFKPGRSEVYLENLAPLFYIDQDEGWTNIQALQISRYGQQQIGEIAVEYLLGALDALKGRVDRLRATQRGAELRDSARLIADQVNDSLIRRGWRVQWSGHGAVSEVLARWSRHKLREVLQENASLDLSARYQAVKERTEKLRTTLTKGAIDVRDASTPITASQAVVELKGRRHALNQDMFTLRTQQEQALTLLESIDHRLFAATDLFRLKTTGVGRVDQLECPTCHRDIDPATFGLTTQTSESVAAHIESLKRDREFMAKNSASLAANIETTAAEIRALDSQLREAENALRTITSAVGPVREQIAATAAELGAAERELERLSDAMGEIEGFQRSIDRWCGDARSFAAGESAQFNTERERTTFLDSLRKYIVALGHSAVTEQSSPMLSLDEQYVPFLNGRRVRALGSASDQARLVAAYSLALAAASQRLQGNHPGFVILDEPLQQNPDPRHRNLFLKFLTENLAQHSQFQTLIFTSLSATEIARLRSSGTSTITPDGQHFLRLEPARSEERA
jgi:DNA repair exonuclease SbcCD ATPase subunit